jgi:CheY-like chemotaxis protein
MGGSLQVESRFGDGATFFFSIPLIEADASTGEAQPEAENDAAPAPHRLPVLAGERQPAVLVVDDRQTNRDILVRLLRLARFEAHEASNGAEALDVLRERSGRGESVDLVLMDVRMPVMDGLEATRRIRADAGLAATKVIAVTASVFQEARQQIMSAGFDDLIGKPLRIEELFEQLGKHLNVEFTSTRDDPPEDGFPTLGTASRSDPGGEAHMPPTAARRTAQRLHDAIEIGDITALSVLAGELSAHPGFAGTVGRDIGRFTRELDFEGLRRLAQSLTSGAARSNVTTSSGNREEASRDGGSFGETNGGGI